jgi:hypothetical protein
LNDALKWVVAPKLEGLDDLGLGYYRAKRKGKYGILDENGAQIIPFDYDQIGHFDEGLVRVQRNGKWGLFHQSGRLQIEPKFDQLGEFKKGVAEAVLNGRKLVIDIEGEPVD